MRQPAVIHIAILDRRSVLLEAGGSFTDGYLDQASDRLTRLAELEFPTVTLDLHGIAEIDRAGRALISTFAMRIWSTGGQLSAVDPTGRCSGIVHEHSVALVPATPDERSRAA
jgi:hypothetical protein